ncbi:MAG: hypothetical protein JOY78_01480 [Pseudonocardia sp.]|nr:hypothetical protein [Pseudonocardia sp.]
MGTNCYDDLRTRRRSTHTHPSRGPSGPDIDDPYRRRLYAALTRDIATLLAIPAGHVVVGDDPIRAYSGISAASITVYDPDDADTTLRFVPETGYTGTGGGAYLLLGACPGCAGDAHSPADFPVMTISGLADLDHEEHLRDRTGSRLRCPSSSTTTPPTRPTAHSAHLGATFGSRDLRAVRHCHRR